MRKIITTWAGIAALFLAIAFAATPTRAVTIAAPTRAGNKGCTGRAVCLRLVGAAMLDHWIRVLLPSLLRLQPLWAVLALQPPLCVLLTMTSMTFADCSTQRLFLILRRIGSIASICLSQPHC